MASNPNGSSLLEPGQIIKRVYTGETDDRIRVDAEVTAVIGNVELDIVQSDDSIAIGDGTTLFSGTTVGSDHGLDVNIIGGVVSGNFTASGLSQGLSSYSITVTDTPTEIPVIANQNGISIRVWGNNTVYFGNSSVSVSQGYPKRFSEEIIMDVKDNTSVRIYAVCEPTQTCELRILAIA